METKFTDRAKFYAYLDKTNADYKVDRNPSEEKLSAIKKAIARKKQLMQQAIDSFQSHSGFTVSL